MAGLATLLLAAACSSAKDGPTQSQVTSAAPANIQPSAQHWLCLDRQPRSAADYKLALNHHDERWQGGDGGVPVRLPDGRIAWLFGDTVVGSVSASGKLLAGKWHIVHGTVLIQRGACFDPLASSATASLTDFVPGATSRQFYWPGFGWVDRRADRLYVMLDRVSTPDETQTASHFKPEGNALAELSLPDLRVLAVHAIPRPPINGTPTWTAKPLRTRGWVYLYARHGFDHYVVRFPDRLDAWRRTGDWQYWTGRSWSVDPDRLGPMEFSEPPLTGLAVLKAGRRYLAVASDADAVTGWSAPTPAGPWKNVGALAETDDGGGGARYGGLAVTQLPGVDPFILWNVAPKRSGTIAGSGIGTGPPLQPLR